MYDCAEVAAEHAERSLTGRNPRSCSKARYYNPQIGRFISEDKLRFFEGPNFYIYTRNRVILFTDPTGNTIYICSRKVNSSFLRNVFDANHGYIWNDKDGSCCDKAGGGGVFFRYSEPCKESGPSIDHCNPVADSEGHEWEIMSCCWFGAQDEKGYMFFGGPGGPWRDCHGFAKECVERRGFKYPGAPGGRIGPPCNGCFAAPPAPPPPCIAGSIC